METVITLHASAAAPRKKRLAAASSAEPNGSHMVKLPRDAESTRKRTDLHRLRQTRAAAKPAAESVRRGRVLE